MIICKACGAQNADDEEFCTNCGRYLEWAGEHVELPPEPEPEEVVEPEPEEPPPPPGFFRRIAIRLGFDGHDDEAEDVDMSGWRAAAAKQDDAVIASAFGAALGNGAHPATPQLAPVAGSDDSEAENATAEIPAIGPGEDPVTTELARVPAADEEDADGEATGALVATGLTSTSVAPVVPVTDPSLRRPGDPVVPVDKSERAIVPRRPTEVPRADRRRPAGRRGTPSIVPVLSDAPAPGDVFCTNCNQFNSPTRVFCRRCGERLPHVEDNTAYAYEPIPFVRRHRHRDAKIVGVGQRPGKWGRAASGGGSSGRTMAIMGRVGTVVIGIGLVLSFVGPYSQPIRSWYTKTFDSLINKVNVQFTQQFSIGANASTTYPNHPAADAVDNNSATYWQSLPSKKANGEAQSITVVFASPTDVDRLGIISGAGPSQQTFLSEARPKEIELFWGPHDSSTKFETLQDSSTFQKLTVRIQNVTSVKLKVITVYPSATGHSVALTEVEFFQRT